MKIDLFIKTVLLILALGLLGYWILIPDNQEFSLRVPIPGNLPPSGRSEPEEMENPGTLVSGSGQPSSLKGSWPQFRGVERNGISAGTPIAGFWPDQGPKVLWKIETGEGHAGAAIHEGRVFLLDYDEDQKEDVIRCLSFDTGKEIWHFSYSSKLKRNHGMSRTVPAVNDDFIVTLGPKCHVFCLRPASGELVWKKDLVAEYGATVPEWYAGQCPLIERNRVILAPGGTCLMTAIRLSDGSTIWETPNPKQWKMTHSSIIPIEFENKRQYVWCADDGVVGVDSRSGDVLWTLPDWKIKIATVPTPVDLGQGRIFFSGGYNTGGAMVQLVRKEDEIHAEILFRTKPKVFGSDQQTPIYHQGLIYGVIPGGKLACLSPEGEQLWVDDTHNFGLGPYLMIDDKLLVLDDDHKKPGQLCLFDINASSATFLAGAEILEGHDAWAPMAFADGRVILRDAKTMVCLDLVN